MIRSRDFDPSNGYEPGRLHYDVRQGTHHVDPNAERYGYGDREWIGMTDADRLYGRACVWPDGFVVAVGDALVFRKLETQYFEEIGPPEQFVRTMWRATFTCGCESIRERIHRDGRELHEMLELGRSQREPRGVLYRTWLSRGCAMHEGMREARAAHRRQIERGILAAFRLLLLGVMPLAVFEAVLDAFDRGPRVPDDPEDHTP